jgi:hypothetical protein
VDYLVHGKLDGLPDLPIRARPDRRHSATKKTLLRFTFEQLEERSFLGVRGDPLYHIVKSLLKVNADVNTQSGDGRSNIVAAVMTNRIDIVKTILDHKAKVNELDGLQSTPLAMAVQKELKSMVSFLLKAKANADSYKGLAWTVASPEMVEYLEKLGAAKYVYGTDADEITDDEPWFMKLQRLLKEEEVHVREIDAKYGRELIARETRAVQEAEVKREQQQREERIRRLQNTTWVDKFRNDAQAVFQGLRNAYGRSQR